MKKEKEEIKFDGMEDLEILIISLCVTYGLTTVNSSSILLKIVFGFIVLVDFVTTANVIRSVFNYIKEKKELKMNISNEIKNEKELDIEYNIEKSKDKNLNIEKEKEMLETIKSEIINNQNEKNKVLTLKK